MRKILLHFLLCFLFNSVFAQYKIEANGLLLDPPKNSKSSVILDTFLLKNDVPLRKAFMKELLKKVELTVNNLQDDSLLLRKQYGAFFCDTFFCNFYNEMVKTKDLLRRGIIDLNAKYFPGREISRWLDTAKVYELKPKVPENRYKLYVIKPFNDFIYRLYKDATYSSIQSWDMDIRYKNAWRQVEYFYKTGNHFLDSLSKAYGTIVSCDNSPQIDEFLKEMNKVISDSCRQLTVKELACQVRQEPIEKMSSLIDHLRSPFGIKQWLWYTGGIITMNPFAITSENRRYPTTERWTLLTDSATYKTIKKDDTESNLMYLFSNQKLYNDIQLPTFNNNGNHKWLVEYFDNKPAYKRGYLPAILSHKDSVNVFIHNVEISSNLKITAEIKGIPDMSNTIIQLNSALDAFPSFSNLIIGANLSNILNNVNSNLKPLITLPKSIVSKAEAKVDHSQTVKFDKVFSQKINALEFNKKSTYTNCPKDEIDCVIIKGQRITFLKDKGFNMDKKKIILAEITFRDECSACKDTVLNYIIDSFIAKDYCVSFDYSSENIDISINSLISRFYQYLDCARKCIQTTKNKIDNLVRIQQYLSAYMTIVNRSLPPDTLELKQLKDENATYSTVLFKTDLQDSSFEETIKVTQVKKINNRDSLITTRKMKFKVGKLRYIDASAGLAFTATDYSVYEGQTTGLPTRKPGDKLQLNAGLHIYPFGLIKVDNRLLPKKPNGAIHRLSLYLGVSIVKPLDNIYTGIGYDIVPGIKAITGSHWYKDTRYQIVNNQVFNQADGLKPSWFLAINIEPLTLTKVLGIIK
jgi:hypothetical protein